MAAGGATQATRPTLASPLPSSSGAVSQTHYTPDGVKAGAVLDSVAGLTLHARKKVRKGRNGVIHSIGAAYNSLAGPLATLKLRPAPGASSVVTLHPRTRVARATAAASPAWLAAGPGKTATLTIDAVAPYGDARTAAGGGKAVKPSAVLGMRWTF